MNKTLQILTIITTILLIIMIEPAFASPGGKIASAMLQTFWGKIILFFLILLFLPLILYTVIREYLAQRHTLNDLQKLNKINSLFDWVTVQERITESFYQIHTAWSKEDMTEASDWMTDWYWKNQQMVYLNQWAKEGLINHCRIKKISDISPLFLACRGDEKTPTGSRLVVSITAKIEDYLAKRETGEIVEGRKGFNDVETIWTFVIQNNQWKVANIEEGVLSLDYAQLTNELPAYIKGYEMDSGKIF